MVASKARKEARKKQLEQAKKAERRQKTEKAVFGEFEDDGDGAGAQDELRLDMGDESAAAASQKSKGSRKAKAETERKTGDSKAGPEKKKAAGEKKEKKKNKKSKDVDQDKPKKEARFICFVGSLPFTATTESISKHFAKLEPTAIRHATSKGTGKSRGFAFLEFERFERMKDCLRLYHHSLFDDGLGGEPRKINIELTAGGGGGKSKDRKERIREKNKKLADERTRRAQTSKDKKDGKSDKQQAADGSKPTVRPAVTGANAVQSEQQDGAIHPSRLARIRG